jgi:hypothetical protein
MATISEILEHERGRIGEFCVEESTPEEYMLVRKELVADGTL